MHELSIVKDIFQTLEQAYPETYKDIIKIEIQAGLLSNIQPVLIQNAFEAYIEEFQEYKKLELEVTILPIIAHCAVCNNTFEVKYHRFVCECGVSSDNIIQGEELKISKVTFNKKDHE
ncbi:hydrogenase maturation nickel metallochaperone HypA [Sphingobacterium shayense]|uniref:hydrogenase maturation nickel metallochaperone HypA/HybF n=1 Tax=Sphingobacterium shayense TaxID=626343 RepID=UPI001557AEB6|nr:hydrogenase maturation nickel metallochaperone HypA [Sphingobacterium shayense]NQD71740.1 hydrogenase maturation nickel metallochaperone HypA [Sphingobacterium shayense]